MTTVRSAEQEARLNEVMEAIASTLDMTEIVEAVARGVLRLLPYMRMIVEETCKPPAYVWKAALRGLIEDSPGPAAPIVAPTLLVWGEDDALVPRWNQDDLLEAIPQAELIVSSFTPIDWDRVTAFLVSPTAFPTVSELTLTLTDVGQFTYYDPNVLMCRVAQQGGYSPSDGTMNPIDQAWLVTLGILDAGQLASTNSGPALTTALAQSKVNDWALSDMTVGFGEWLRQTGTISC